MLDPILTLPLLAAIALSLMAGPLGCFVVWKRMAYFGDALGHAALLGVVFGVVLGVSNQLGIVVVALTFALLLFYLQSVKHLASDTLLGVLSQGALALGLVLLALTHTTSIDLNAYLFGDVLAVSEQDIAFLFGLAAFILLLLFALRRVLLMTVISSEIAAVEGVPVRAMKALVMLLVALVVASGIKIVGMLLITAMLILPAATARHMAHTPWQMALLAICVGVIASILGLNASFYWDVPSGPAIVLSAIGLFIAAGLSRQLLRR